MRTTKKIGSKFMSLLIIVAMIICTCAFSPVETVNAQTGSTASKKSVQAVNAVYRGMIKDGNTFYMRTDGGIISYNIRTKKSKKLVKKINSSWGPMLMYNGYIYYTDTVNDVKCIYRVDVEGKKAPKLIARNASLGFVYKNRIYYDNNGLCSMSLNGANKRRYARSKESSMFGSYVFFYKNRFFYGDVDKQYSVDTNCKNKRKSRYGYENLVNAVNFINSASSVEMKKGMCWVDPDNSTGNWNTITYSKEVGKKSIRKTIYKSSRNSVRIIASSDSGYMLIAENSGNLKKTDSRYKKGTVKIINLSGKVLATLKNSQK